MNGLAKAKDPFKFYERLHLTELTGLRASTLSQLSGLIKKAPDSCIYYHTHRFLQQHQHVSPEPPNDFAYWVSEALNEDELAEQLSSINIIQYPAISGLRDKFSETVDVWLEGNSLARLKFARQGEEFHFMKSASFIIPTKYAAFDLREFTQALRQVTVESIYFHIFEARLRLKRQANDFSLWIEGSLGDRQLADEISSLDPYTYTLEGLRKTIIKMAEERVFG